jgi:effector-binding domain-containing protein
MKVLKILAVIILILVAVYFIVPIFLADNVVVSQSQEIKAKPETVFRQVNSLENWVNWSPFEADSTMVSTFTGPERGLGAKREWSGTQAGDGSMEIVLSEPYNYIRTNIQFGPGQGGGEGSWVFTPTDEGVDVSWSIHLTDLSYPNARWMGLMMKPILEPMIKQGLNDLKEVAEQMPRPPDVSVVKIDKIPALIIPDSATVGEMEAMFQRNFDELYTYVTKKGIPVNGKPFAIFHNWNPQGYTRISTGIPVAPDSKGKKDIKYFEIPAGEAIFSRYVGGPNTAPAHYAIEEYIKDMSLQPSDYIWETYLYDSMKDSDTTKWVTEIYYPL